MKFCPMCGAKYQPEWLFCAQCGAAIAADAQRPPGPSANPGAAFAVFCVLALVGVGMWIRILNKELRTGPPGSPITTSPRVQNRGAGGPGATLPEGHPPVDRLELQEETKKFIAELAAEAAKRPRDTTAWERLAEAQRRATRIDRSYYPESLKSYRHVLELAPENTKALRGLASIHYDLGEYENARPYLEKYVTLTPDDPGAQTDLATVTLRLGDVERAIATYRDVIATHPRFIQARLNLALTLSQTGDDSQALEVLRQAREVARDDPTRAQIDRLMAKLDEGP